MITSYDTMPLGIYNRITAILDDKDKSAFDQQVAIVAALDGLTEQQVLDLPVPEFKARTHQLGFLEAPAPEPTPTRPDRVIRAGDFDLRIVMPGDMNTAQFVDYQTLVTADRLDYPALLAVFLVPYGKTYGHSGDDDKRSYDVEAVRRAISDSFTVTYANNVCAFFLRRFERSFNRTVTSFTRNLERAAKKVKDPSKRSEIQERLRALQELGAGWMP